MNFTREPIIETVITPKDGFKLLIRSSKSGGEEFFVDAVEVVSFGSAFFFRSLEKPKSFLVPINDYEAIEVRESRMVLKTTALERGIKIAGGREAPLKVAREESVIPDVDASAASEQRTDKRRERRRSRKKKGRGEQEEENQEMHEETPFLVSEPTKEKKVERPSLIPPPATLISETMMKHKTGQQAEMREEEERRSIIPPPPFEPEMGESSEEDEEIPF